MRQETVNIYEFSELDSETQQKIINRFRENEDFSWIWYDVEKTLEEFCNIFPLTWSQLDPFDTYRSSWSVHLDETVEELTGQRLAKYIWNNYKDKLYRGKYYSTSGQYDDSGKYHYKYRYSKIQLENCCVLTGICYDDSLLSPIYDFLQDPKENINLNTLLNDCMCSLLSDVAGEIEGNQTAEAITENIEANNYEFYIDGSMV